MSTFSKIVSGGVIMHTDDARGFGRGVKFMVVVASGRTVDEDIIGSKDLSKGLCFIGADLGIGFARGAD